MSEETTAPVKKERSPEEKKAWGEKMQAARRAKKAEKKAIKAAPAVKVKEEGKITFFTEMDIDSKGRMKSSYPFYFNTKRMDEAKEEYRRLKGMIDRREVPSEYTGEVMAKINAYEAEMAAIERNKPRVQDIGRIKKYRDGLEEVIKPTMFTKKDMIDGLVDPNEEARRMSEPTIPVPAELRELLVNNGGKLSSDGKASRDDLTRTWQMCQWHLRNAGEYTSLDAEYLRQR
jgi:hypothetical protein